jgi:signal transduction histidine kinase
MDRELRTIVFAIEQDPEIGDLSAIVTQLVIDGRRALGFAPVLSFHGNVDAVKDTEQARELLAALRESLGNIARHAQATAASITVAFTGGQDSILRLSVIDDGVGQTCGSVAGNGLRNLAARAERFGGNAAILPVTGGGTCVDWWVPVTRTFT